MRLRLLLLLMLIIPGRPAISQVTRHHGVFWGRLVLADKLTEKLKWELYLQKRTQNIPGEKSIFGASHFSSVWFWLNYSVSKNLRLSVSPFGYFDSYAFLTEPGDVDIPGVKEFRWTARLEQEQKFRIFKFSNRYGVEYRRRDLLHNSDYQPNWRIRYMAKLEKSVPGILKNKPVSFFLTDEVFIQFGKAVRQYPNVFDQNRISAGFSVDLLRNIKISASYLNIIQERLNGRDFDDAHSLWVVLTLDNLFSQFRPSPKKDLPKSETPLQ